MGADNRPFMDGRTVGVYLGQSDAERLRKLAQRESVSQSEAIRRLLIAGESDPLLLRSAQMSIYAEVYS